MSMTHEEAIKHLLLDWHINLGCDFAIKPGRLDDFLAALDVALSALHPVAREQVEKVWRGEWEWFDETVGTPIDGYEREWGWQCSKCKTVLPDEFDNPDGCPAMRVCQLGGAHMTDEAVEMVMKGMEEMKNG